MTNWDNIKAMDAIEFAETIMEDNYCDFCIHHYRGDCEVCDVEDEKHYCRDSIKQWLEQEAE